MKLLGPALVVAAAASPACRGPATPGAGATDSASAASLATGAGATGSASAAALPGATGSASAAIGSASASGDTMAPASAVGVLRSIAKGIAELAARCPQLATFDPAAHLHQEGMAIDFDYHTHEPERRGGWASAVPNPDPDGIWLHIDVHDAASPLQLHTQPAVPMIDLGGGQRLMLLVLEGSAVPACAGAISELLAPHGKSTW